MTAELEFRAMGSDAHVIVVGADGLGADLAELPRPVAASTTSSSGGAGSSPTARSASSTRRAGDDRLGVARDRPARRAGDRGLAPQRRQLRPDRARRRDPRRLRPLVRRAARAHRGRGRASCCTAAPTSGSPSDGVRLPGRHGFDPGGIGKGLAADLVVDEVMAAGAAGVCVNLGGDLRVRGESPTGPADRWSWTVAIEHPWSSEPIALRRPARRRGGDVDHAAPPLDGRRRGPPPPHRPRHRAARPTRDLTLATVVAGEAWIAEVLAKAVLLRGSAHPFDLLGGTGAEALVVDDTGRVPCPTDSPRSRRRAAGPDPGSRIDPRGAQAMAATTQLWWYTARSAGIVVVGAAHGQRAVGASR